jgi:hypothetical protein
MWCDNCGAKVDDDAVFCSTCGQQLLPTKKAPKGTPVPSRPSERYKRKEEDFLCFGEQSEENPYVGAFIFIAIGLFLIIIFFFPGFPIEYLVPLAFLAFGIYFIIKARRGY